MSLFPAFSLTMADLVRETGVCENTLKCWGRRYGCFGRPVYREGRRLFTDTELLRLKLAIEANQPMKQAFSGL